MKRQPLTHYFPFLLPVSIFLRSNLKKFSYSSSSFALERNNNFSEWSVVYSHKSVLRRKLGDADPELQENKIKNLQIAVERINALRLKSGQSFSFWNQIGEPSASRGFVDGMYLSNGAVSRGVGGGLCQLANLLYWMVLHSPLEVVEHHHHQLDIFPDSGRVLPFGSGASVFYNYGDLQFKNTTKEAWGIHVWLTETHLCGQLFCEQPIDYSFHVIEKNHRFYKKGQAVFRANELWQHCVEKKTGFVVSKRLITKNDCRVLYQVDLGLIQE